MTIPSVQDMARALAEVKAMTPKQKQALTIELKELVWNASQWEAFKLGWQLYRVMSVSRGGRDLME